MPAIIGQIHGYRVGRMCRWNDDRGAAAEEQAHQKARYQPTRVPHVNDAAGAWRTV